LSRRGLLGDGGSSGGKEIDPRALAIRNDELNLVRWTCACQKCLKMQAACVLGDCCFSYIRTGELFEHRRKALRLHPRAYHAGRWCEILAVLVLYFLTVGKLVYTEEPAVSQAQLLPMPLLLAVRVGLGLETAGALLGCESRSARFFFLALLCTCAWAWALRRRAPCWGASRGARGSPSWPCSRSACARGLGV